MDYLTWLLLKHQEQTPKRTWPAAPSTVLWFPAVQSDDSAGISSARRGAAEAAVPAAALESVTEQAGLLETFSAAEADLQQLQTGGQHLLSAAKRESAGTIGSLPLLQDDTAAIGGTSPLSMEEISRYFERDARRY